MEKDAIIREVIEWLQKNISNGKNIMIDISINDDDYTIGAKERNSFNLRVMIDGTSGKDKK